jgi:hypothetical protein
MTVAGGALLELTRWGAYLARQPRRSDRETHASAEASGFDPSLFVLCLIQQNCHDRDHDPVEKSSPQVMEGRYSDVKAPRDGKWVYATDHASVPLPPRPRV